MNGWDMGLVLKLELGSLARDGISEPLLTDA